MRIFIKSQQPLAIFRSNRSTPERRKATAGNCCTGCLHYVTRPYFSSNIELIMADVLFTKSLVSDCLSEVAAQLFELPLKLEIGILECSNFN